MVSMWVDNTSLHFAQMLIYSLVSTILLLNFKIQSLALKQKQALFPQVKHLSNSFTFFSLWKYGVSFS